jgi:shikimate kinase
MTTFLPFSERNLIMTGYMGPDQPLLGKEIATRLKMNYVNLEAEIAQRMDMPIDEIRTYFGETRLRAVETEIVGEAVLRRSSVIRVNGRTLVQGNNLERLRSTGPIFCLTIGLDAMLQRMHIYMGARYHNPKDRALAIGELKREWAVRDLSDIQEIDTTYMSDEDIIRTLVGVWRSLTVRGV